MKICILYSGGADSLCMLHYAKINHPEAEIVLCYYDLGQDYAFKEMKQLPANVKIRKLDWLGNGVGAVAKENTQAIMIPGRNMALAVLAACQELPNEIWMGALMGEIHDKATDKNMTFLKTLNITLGYVLAPYGVTPKARFPLADAGFGKFEAIEWYLNNGGDPQAMLNSSSCLTAEATDTCDNCGHCIVCMRRWGIFSQLGLKEEYIHHPIKDISPENATMLLEMAIGDDDPKYKCHYDAYRRREIMPAFYDYVAMTCANKGDAGVFLQKTFAKATAKAT